jgi:hypothetical protein
VISSFRLNSTYGYQAAMDDMRSRYRSQYLADKFTGEEHHVELAGKDEKPNEWPKENQEEEVSYLTVRKAVSTEGLMQENDRTSPSIEDFDRRSSATFQLEGQESSVDVHFVGKNSFLCCSVHFRQYETHQSTFPTIF